MYIAETEGGFKCPNPKDNPNPGTFSRHAHPDDCRLVFKNIALVFYRIIIVWSFICRKYYICLEGSPREYGCPIGTVYQIGADQFSGRKWKFRNFMGKQVFPNKD